MTGDMYALDYAAGRPDLVINTSCEHIADRPAWLALLPRGTRSCCSRTIISASRGTSTACASLERIPAAGGALPQLPLPGALPMKKYTRFMLIGRSI